jgi:hypothetical protein
MKICTPWPRKREVEDLDQRGLALEQLEQLLQAPMSCDRIAHREQVALAGDHVLLAALGERAAGVERRAHQARDFLAHVAHLRLQPRARRPRSSGRRSSG